MFILKEFYGEVQENRAKVLTLNIFVLYLPTFPCQVLVCVAKPQFCEGSPENEMPSRLHKISTEIMSPGSAASLIRHEEKSGCGRSFCVKIN